jgi:hypothetical protein
MKSGTVPRRLTGAAAAIGLVVTLAGCDVHLQGDLSRADITRTCKGEADHIGPWDHRTQILVTVDADAGENHNILISFNDGAQTSGLADVAPGGGLGTLSELNVTEIDIAVVPSDATGPFDTYHQVFNPCPPPRP